MPIGLAAGVSLLVSLVGLATRALTRSGAVAATAVGALILWQTGWPGGLVLATFFVTSTLVGRVAALSGANQGDAKGETRDHWQVLANGGAAAVGALAERLAPGLGLRLVAVGLAAASADTWATSLGALSPRPPRDILRGQVVPPGTSGGVSWVGTSGGLMGAALVAIAAALGGGGSRSLYLTAVGLGFLGMLLDSVLGAGLQGRFRCPTCAVPTERRVHRCGTPAQRERGFAWLNNDGVNALSTIFVTALGAVLWLW